MRMLKSILPLTKQRDNNDTSSIYQGTRNALDTGATHHQRSSGRNGVGIVGKCVLFEVNAT